MSEREQYPAGVPCWVETLQPDPRAALDFYGPLLGWEFAEPGPMPGDLAGEYFVARVRGRDVAGIGSLPDLGGPPTAIWSTYIRVDSADEAAESAQAAGGSLLIGPLDRPSSGAFGCAGRSGGRGGLRVGGACSRGCAACQRAVHVDYELTAHHRRR